MYQHLSFPDFVLRYFIMIVTQITKHGLCVYTVLDILEELREVKDYMEPWKKMSSAWEKLPNQ